MKLISMINYVLSVNNDDLNEEKIESIFNYANFLKQPLQLGMFVPCDAEGNVLEEPERWKDYLNHPDSFDGNKESGKMYEYEEAKQRVLIKDFETRGGIAVSRAICKTFQTIEDLTAKKIPLVNLELTESAIKQIGL